MVIVVVLKWGNKQNFTASTGIKKFPARLGYFSKAIVAYENHRGAGLKRPVNNGSLSWTDSWRDKYCSQGEQSVTLARYFLLAHAP